MSFALNIRELENSKIKTDFGIDKMDLVKIVDALQ